MQELVHHVLHSVQPNAWERPPPASGRVYEVIDKSVPLPKTRHGQLVFLVTVQQQNASLTTPTPAPTPTTTATQIPIDRFLEAPPEDFICPICTHVFGDPVSTVCGHIFCRQCITRSLATNPRCPQCTNTTDPRDLRLSKSATLRIARMMVRCDFSQQGCDTVMRVEDMAEHEMGCDFGPAVCPFRGCRFFQSTEEGQGNANFLLRRDILTHLNTCTHRDDSIDAITTVHRLFYTQVGDIEHVFSLLRPQLPNSEITVEIVPSKIPPAPVLLDFSEKLWVPIAAKVVPCESLDQINSCISAELSPVLGRCLRVVATMDPFAQFDLVILNLVNAIGDRCVIKHRPPQHHQQQHQNSPLPQSHQTQPQFDLIIPNLWVLDQRVAVSALRKHIWKDKLPIRWWLPLATHLSTTTASSSIYAPRIPSRGSDPTNLNNFPPDLVARCGIAADYPTVEAVSQWFYPRGKEEDDSERWSSLSSNVANSQTTTTTSGGTKQQGGSQSNLFPSYGPDRVPPYHAMRLRAIFGVPICVIVWSSIEFFLLSNFRLSKETAGESCSNSDSFLSTPSLPNLPFWSWIVLGFLLAEFLLRSLGTIHFFSHFSFDHLLYLCWIAATQHKTIQWVDQDSFRALRLGCVFAPLLLWTSMPILTLAETSYFLFPASATISLSILLLGCALFSLVFGTCCFTNNQFMLTPDAKFWFLMGIVMFTMNQCVILVEVLDVKTYTHTGTGAVFSMLSVLPLLEVARRRSHYNQHNEIFATQAKEFLEQKESERITLQLNQHYQQRDQDQPQQKAEQKVSQPTFRLDLTCWILIACSQFILVLHAALMQLLKADPREKYLGWFLLVLNGAFDCVVFFILQLDVHPLLIQLLWLIGRLVLFASGRFWFLGNCVAVGLLGLYLTWIVSGPAAPVGSNTNATLSKVLVGLAAGFVCETMVCWKADNYLTRFQIVSPTEHSQYEIGVATCFFCLSAACAIQYLRVCSEAKKSLKTSTTVTDVVWAMKQLGTSSTDRASTEGKGILMAFLCTFGLGVVFGIFAKFVLLSGLMLSLGLFGVIEGFLLLAAYQRFVASNYKMFSVAANTRTVFNTDIFFPFILAVVVMSVHLGLGRYFTPEAPWLPDALFWWPLNSTLVWFVYKQIASAEPEVKLNLLLGGGSVFLVTVVISFLLADSRVIAGFWGGAIAIFAMVKALLSTFDNRQVETFVGFMIFVFAVCAVWAQQIVVVLVVLVVWVIFYAAALTRRLQFSESRGNTIVLFVGGLIGLVVASLWLLPDSHFFFSFSVCCAAVCILLATQLYHQWNVDTNPNTRTFRIFSPQIFPVLVMRSDGDFTEANHLVWYVVWIFCTMITWGVVAEMFQCPTYVGMSVAALNFALLAIFLMSCMYHNNQQFCGVDKITNWDEIGRKDLFLDRAFEQAKSPVTGENNSDAEQSHLFFCKPQSSQQHLAAKRDIWSALTHQSSRNSDATRDTAKSNAQVSTLACALEEYATRYRAAQFEYTRFNLFWALFELHFFKLVHQQYEYVMAHRRSFTDPTKFTCAEEDVLDTFKWPMQHTPVATTVGGSHGSNLKWRQACTDAKTATLFSGPPTISQIMYGPETNCWVLMALQCLCLSSPERIESLFVKTKCNSEKLFFTCNLYHDGKLHEITVDAYLPFCERYLFFYPERHGRSPMVVLWPCILEKCYAVLHGSYKALHHNATWQVLFDIAIAQNRLLHVEQNQPPNHHFAESDGNTDEDVDLESGTGSPEHAGPSSHIRTRINSNTNSNWLSALLESEGDSNLKFTTFNKLKHAFIFTKPTLSGERLQPNTAYQLAALVRDNNQTFVALVDTNPAPKTGSFDEQSGNWTQRLRKLAFSAKRGFDGSWFWISLPSLVGDVQYAVSARFCEPAVVSKYWMLTANWDDQKCVVELPMLHQRSGLAVFCVEQVLEEGASDYDTVGCVKTRARTRSNIVAKPQTARCLVLPAEIKRTSHKLNLVRTAGQSSLGVRVHLWLSN